MFSISRWLASLPPGNKLKITDPEIIYQRFSPLLSHLKYEVFFVLCLNSANRLIKEIEMSRGILNSSLVHPREVFKEAILESSASIILMHNHPSGEVEPSREDRQITERLVEVGALMNIPVLDHIIIGNNYYSFRENGLIGG